MIYPSSKSTSLDLDLFSKPPAEYRGAPFWAWNGALRRDELFEQLRVFKEMGLGGAHFHVRVGLQMPYLGDSFMALIRDCVEECERLGLRAWLYDEDRWPSGAAGGLVTANPALGMKHLLITRVPYGTEEPGSSDPNDAAARSRRSDDGVLVRRFEVILNDGRLEEYREIPADEESSIDVQIRGNADRFEIYVYVERNRAIPWFNNQTYLDTLNPEAVREFVRVTHERYREVVGDRFGTTIPSIFTDEPQYNQPTLLPTPYSIEDLVFPFTGDFEETYRQAFGESFLDRVPELVWESDRSPTTRYRFFEHASERFAAAFADTVGAWCSENGIALTGHLMEEPTLFSQTHATGEAMRSYRGFQLPGIDLLCDRVELTTAKQAQSAARQFGREGVLSELYGVTGWHFDFRGHKLQGDWQAALGVTARVHHLAWVTMEGEAKRDYPAAIGYQSPWCGRYSIVEDHFARLNTVLTRGTAVCRVAVIHPIESYWMRWGPRSQTDGERQEQDRRFADVTDWLLRNHIDFDFVAESHVDQFARVDGRTLAVGEMRYEVVVVPSLATIRSETLDRLSGLMASGGSVIVAGELPTYLDGVGDTRAADSLAAAVRIPFTRTAILSSLEAYRDVRIVADDGSAGTNLIYQLRSDGDAFWLFISHVDPPIEAAAPEVEIYSIFVRGLFAATLFETQPCRTVEIDTVVTDDDEPWTELAFTMAAHDSLLIRLERRHDGVEAELESNRGTVLTSAVAPGPATESTGLLVGRKERTLLPQPTRYALSEPNVLLLDQAEWRVDDGEWQPEEEVLRLDQLARKTLGWPQRGGRMAQPWVEPDDPDARHQLSMRFRIETEIPLSLWDLAFERPSDSSVTLDGEVVQMRDRGFWVDRSIRRIALPPLEPGLHRLEITTTVSRRTGAEWCYLLGSFGVRVRGRYAVLEALPETLLWGDITRQGFPFYAGNVTYEVPLQSPLPLHPVVQVADFAAPLIDVALKRNGVAEELSPIAWAPYAVELPKAASFQQENGEPPALTLTSYGNRQNAFGPVHCSLRNLSWYGPAAWRTEGNAWSYEYQLEPTGILATPAILH